MFKKTYLNCIQFLLLAGVSVGTQASLLIVPDGPSTPFVGEVNECLGQFDAAGNPIKAIIDSLRTSQRIHIIIPGTGLGETAAASNQGSQLQADGTPGQGSDSSTKWDPSFRGPLSGGDIVEPCDALLHELYHAYEFDQGMGDSSDEPGTGNPAANPPLAPIPRSEVNAVRMQNRFRDHVNRPPPPNNQRQKYGNTPVPPSAKAPF